MERYLPFFIFLLVVITVLGTLLWLVPPTE
jgi:hypothetical protein